MATPVPPTVNSVAPWAVAIRSPVAAPTLSFRRILLLPTCSREIVTAIGVCRASKEVDDLPKVAAVCVAVEVGEGFGVVGDHGIEVEGLRVGEVGVGDGNGDAGPVGGEPAAEAAGVVAGAEVVVAGFGVALFAFELVGVGGGAVVGVGVLAAPSTALRAGSGIEVGVVAEGAVVLRHHARGAEKVFGVEFGIAASGKHGDALAAEENVFVERCSGGASFGKDFAAGGQSQNPHP